MVSVKCWRIWESLEPTAGMKILDGSDRWQEKKKNYFT